MKHPVMSLKKKKTEQEGKSGPVWEGWCQWEGGRYKEIV
jgi:hypothetical protein